MIIEAIPGQPNRQFTTARPEWEILDEGFKAHDRFAAAYPNVRIDALMPISFSLKIGAAIAGCYPRPVAYELAAHRADLVRATESKKPEADRTGMAVVIGDGSAAKSFADRLGLEWTNDNGIAHVLGGRVRDLQRLREEAGAKFRGFLTAEGIYHSPLRQEDSERFAEILSKYDFADPQIPIISSTNPRELRTGEDVKKEMVEQMTRRLSLNEILAYIRNMREGDHTLFDISVDGTFQKLLRRVPGFNILTIAAPNESPS